MVTGQQEREWESQPSEQKQDAGHRRRRGTRVWRARGRKGSRLHMQATPDVILPDSHSNTVRMLSSPLTHSHKAQ